MRLVIIGIGGFGREVVHAARAYVESSDWTVMLADERSSPPIFGFPVLSIEEIRDSDRVVLAIGDGPTRRALMEKYPYLHMGNVIAPTASFGRDVEIGAGAVFCDHTMVTGSVRIGRQFQCNIYSYVAHDCVIGDYVTFAPRVCCNGNVYIEDDCYIGTGAIIKQGTSERPIIIGKGATVGMGAVVTKDVPAGTVVIGNPARVML